MKCFSVTSGTAVFLLLPFLALAQVQISFPTTRAVFQRDNANQATIRIIGYYTASPITRIEARLLAREAGQGTSTDWRTIQDAPTGASMAVISPHPGAGITSKCGV